MGYPDHYHQTQPREIGFPGYPGFPALPAAARLCYAIADGCAECADRGLDDAAGDLHVTAAMVAFTAEVIVVAHKQSFPVILGIEPTRPAAHVPGPDFTVAARAAWAACPATCGANGIPSARDYLATLSQPERVEALADAVRLLGVYQPRNTHFHAAMDGAVATT